MVELEELRSLPELAAELDLPYSTLAECVREGRIKATRIGRQWITTKAAVYAAIRSHKLRPAWRWYTQHRAELYPERPDKEEA